MIKLHNITKTYGNRCILDVDDYTFEKNKIYSIMGTNGCGKSSLLKSIMNMLEIDGGSIDISNSQDIHYLPQYPYVFKGSVADNLFTKVLDSNEIKHSDMYNLLQQDANSLSGGERQKMLLLRAISQNKKIMLLDEPTSDMDVEGTIRYEQILKEYQRETEGLIIIVTHSLSQSLRFSDELIFMKDGKIVESGSTKEIIQYQKSDEFAQFVKFHQVK